MIVSESIMRGLSKTKAFLDAPRREWQFGAFAWLLRNCGGYAKFLETTLVLPTEDHFPDRGMKGHAAAAALFRQVRDHAGMADWPCVVEPRPDAEPMLTIGEDRIPVITYRPDETDQTVLVATFARELARYLVETFDEIPPGGEALREQSIDIAAVFLGFGVFMANSKLSSARHALNEGEFANALALFCLLRKIDPESIDAHLNPHLRKYVRLAACDLVQHGIRFRELRSAFAAPSVDSAEQTRPSAR
jgi:hypothetical protein